MSNTNIVIIKGSWTPVTPGKSIPCIIYKNTDESEYLLLFKEDDAIKGGAYYVLQHNKFTFTVYTNQRYLGLKLTEQQYTEFITTILDRKKEYHGGYWDSNLIPNHFIKEIEIEAKKKYNNGAYNFLLGGRRRKRTIKRKRRSTRRRSA